MFKLKKNSVEQKALNPMSLNYFIFSVKQQYGDLKDHSLIAQLINERFNLKVTKDQVDDYYGFNDILVECFEDESRKQIYKLKH